MSCNLDDVRQIIRHQLHLQWANPELHRRVAPVMLWGPPGVGKSTVIRELCKEEGITFLDIRLAQREPIDIRGLPVPREDGMHWVLPAEWPRDPESRGIILFDELTAADRSMQVAAYELILDRRLGDLYEVPPGWYIVAAGNRTADRAVAMTMSSALANRFLHLDVEANVEVWAKWARANDIDPLVIAFLRLRPEQFLNMSGNLERGWPSPRSWERVGYAMQEGDGLNGALLQEIVLGLVGESAAEEFGAYRRLHAELPDARGMLHGEADIVLPTSTDGLLAFCSAVAYHLWRGDDNERALDRFYEIGLQLRPSFAAMLMSDALANPSPERSARLLAHPRFQEWTKRHGTAFSEPFGLGADALVDEVLAPGDGFDEASE